MSKRKTQHVTTAPTRRGRPRWIWAVALLGVVLAGGFAGYRLLRSPASAPDIRRTLDQNVLLITIDTWRADALGIAGGKVATPNLDRLAAIGTRFDFAHSQAVVTLPAHTSILTGLYPFQHGVRENAGFRLDPSVPTVAPLLRSKGFATGAFIGSFALDSRFGLSPSFDVYDERYGQSNVNSGFAMPERRADAVVAAAVGWITRQQGKWFAWVHLFDPHAPYRPPAPFDAQYAGRPYYGEVAFTDASLAPLLEAAHDPSSRPTLVIVTGDHGESLGEHGELTHGLFAYESTLHVPLIVAQLGEGTARWSGIRLKPDPTYEGAGATPEGAGAIRLKPDPTYEGAGATPEGAGGTHEGAGGTYGAGSTYGAGAGDGHASHVAARHVDIVPTILDALGLAVPGPLPGRSLLAAGRGEGETPVTSYFEALSASFNGGWAPLTGVLRGREKYVDLPIAELYDLAKDAGEASNLAGSAPERRRLLQATLRQFGPLAPGARTGEDPDARARLQALGYVTGESQQKARYTEEDDPKTLVGLDAQIHHAVELYDSKRPREAMRVYEEVIAARPSMELPYLQLASLCWEVGETAQAISTLRAALGAGVRGLEVRTRLGTYLVETGNLKEGLPLLESTVRGSAGDVDALNALGIGLARTGRVGEAQATFERILAENPSNTLAVENLGSIALEQGRMDEARRYFSRVLEADPGSAQANNGLGVVEIKAGNRKSAIEHWRRAVEGDPQNFDALYNLATELVNDGRPAEARPFLERFARTAPPALYARDIRHVRDVIGRIGAQ